MLSLVSSPDPPENAKRASGVLSDISCHMGRGLWCKECHNYILHLGLKFPDDLDCCTVWFTKACYKATKFLGKAENELRGKFFLSSIAYVMHIKLRVLEFDSSSQIRELPRPM